MPKAVMFDCYNTLLRYESQEDKERIWEMMLEAIQYMTEKELTITPEELETLYQKACDTEERKCIEERGPHAEVSFSRAWYEVLTKLNIPKKMAEEKAEDMSKLDKWLNDHMGEKMMAVISVISAVLGVGLSFLIFMYIPTLAVDLFDDYILRSVDLAKYHPLFEGVLRIIIFISYMVVVSKMSMIKRVFMYHGAEHKAIFCYENGLDLTVENVKKMSRFHPRCGTAFMFVMLIISMFLSFSLVVIFPELQTISKILWIMVKIAILPLVMGIGYEFIKLAGKHDNIIVSILAYPGLLMQRITTVEPTDDIIEVAIESIKAVITDNPEDDKI